MNDSSPKTTFFLNSVSSAPRRPQKLGSVQSIVRDESDKNAPPPFEEIFLSDDEETPSQAKVVRCQTCSKDITQWMNSRRDIHKKVCKQKQLAKETEKRTQRKSKTLTETIEKYDQVIEKPFLEPEEPPKSWELSKNNVKFARITADDEENRRRKRPRSFAVVELAPKKCQCEVLTTLHSRFVDEFHSKSLNIVNKKEKGVTEHAFQMKIIIGKLSRFEQLSSDLQKTLDDTSTPTFPMISINSSDGHNLRCHSLILKHRTSLLKIHPRSENIEIAQPRDVLKTWLTFVFTANIEWSKEEKEGVKELAMKYGPVGLENLLKEEKDKEEEATVIEEKAHVNIELKSSSNNQKTTDEPLEEDKEEENIVPEEDLIVEESVTMEHVVEPIDFYETDNPLIGFGEDNDYEEEPIHDADIILDDPPNSTAHSTLQKSRDNLTMDSFDEWSNQPNNIQSTSSPPITVVTPVRNAPKPIFGSHIKILKTNDITPMPQFDVMDESELKERMKEIGMRPKGKKAMIQILKRAYTTLHPEVCVGTPTLRPLIRDESLENVVGKQSKKLPKRKSLNERIEGSPKKKNSPTKQKASTVSDICNDVGEDDVDSQADKTLNISNDEHEFAKVYSDNIGEEEDDDEDSVATSSSDKPTDPNNLKKLFLNWLRDEQNSVLYEHILSLQPVSLEEMLVRLEKSEGPLGRIGKGKLVKILENLRITYQLPQKPGRARAGGFKRRL
ncbi:hypothetical protein L3Y34_001302 [Caenorhabditis briggsae]|uniref:Uncharacterized protein n=1 Tax=Caenorhabditis briggsae TaxID=6238 RepID=A0AAE9DBQ0_CAEBR|nr:hypothetical protein L3Y34_001302 [Caenorhabditis briggsae]